MYYMNLKIRNNYEYTQEINLQIIFKLFDLL